MKNKILFLFLLIGFQINAQITYTAADFASPGDEFLLSTGVVDTISPPDFSMTGEAVAWDFSNLAILTQDPISYTSAANSGYQQGFIFSCILNGGNVLSCSQLWGELVNIAIKGEIDFNIPNVPVSNIVRMGNKTDDAFAQTVIGLSFMQGNLNIPLANAYDNIDTIYQFPMTYQSNHQSKGRVLVGIQDGPTGDLAYITNTSREVEVDGYGSLKTPYRTYTNTLKVRSTIQYVDSLILDTATIAIPEREAIEYEWFDLEYGIPVLSVTANRIAGTEIISSIQFIDTARCLLPMAFSFATPFNPSIDANGQAEVNFSNQSFNADSYNWDFGDGGTSTQENPTHTYSEAGTYPVILIACNTMSCSPPICDTIELTVTVSDSTPVNTLEVLTDVGIRIFPSPVVDNLQIDIQELSPSAASSLELRLYDVHGQQLKQVRARAGQQSLNMADLPQGLYVLLVSDGVKGQVFKVVK